MRMMSIASGSSGNCIYVGTDHTHILIDDGISKKRVTEGLSKLDLELSDIQAVFVTHEHDDHISGLGVLERCREIPLYGTKGTLGHISRSTKLGAMPSDIYHPFLAGDQITIGDLTVSSISISHDAKDPVGYTVAAGSQKVGIATDLGYYDDTIVSFYADLDAALVESNHDINMLLTGPYPYPLKQRILGARGHLSNEDCGRFLGKILNEHMKRIYLGHLSKENNFPELAYSTVRLEVNLGENPYKADDFDIQVADRDGPSEIIHI